MQQLPQEILAHIFSFLFSKELETKHVMKLLRLIYSFLLINKEIYNKMMCKSFFNILTKDLTLLITEKHSIKAYKYLRKFTNNLCEINNLILNYSDFRQTNEAINVILKLFENLNNFEIRLYNYFNELEDYKIETVKNLNLDIYLYRENNDNIENFILKNISVLGNVKLVIDYNYYTQYNQQIFNIINTLQKNKKNTELCGIFTENQQILKLSQFTKLFTNVTFNYIKNPPLKTFTNLKIIKLYEAKEEIILKDLKFLEIIEASDCFITILNCPKLYNVRLSYSEYCCISEINNLYYLRLDDVKKAKINITKIHNFTINYNTLLDLNCDFIENIILLNKFDYFSKSVTAAITKAKILSIGVTNCKELPKLLGQYKNLNTIMLNSYNNIFSTNLAINYNMLNNLCENNELIKLEQNTNSFIFNNINNLNIEKFYIRQSELGNIDFINFNSLLECEVLQSSTFMNITNLINLKKLKVIKQITINYNHFNLSYLRIERNRNLFINLNNLPNLKNLDISYCEGIKLQNNCKMKLQKINLYYIKKLNINLQLNCPKLEYFFVRYFPSDDDIINFVFCNTPLLSFPIIFQVEEELTKDLVDEYNTDFIR